MKSPRQAGLSLISMLVGLGITGVALLAVNNMVSNLYQIQSKVSQESIKDDIERQIRELVKKPAFIKSSMEQPLNYRFKMFSEGTYLPAVGTGEALLIYNDAVPPKLVFNGNVEYFSKTGRRLGNAATPPATAAWKGEVAWQTQPNRNYKIVVSVTPVGIKEPEIFLRGTQSEAAEVEKKVVCIDWPTTIIEEPSNLPVPCRGLGPTCSRAADVPGFYMVTPTTLYTWSSVITCPTNYYMQSLSTIQPYNNAGSGSLTYSATSGQCFAVLGEPGPAGSPTNRIRCQATCCTYPEQ